MNTLVSPRRPVIAVTASFLGLLPLALALATLLLLALDLSRLGEGGPDYALRSIVSVVIRVAIAALGAFVISRQSENVVGWLIWAYGGLGLLEHFTHEYAIHTLGGDPGSLPGGEVAAWLQSWLWIAEFAATAFISSFSLMGSSSVNAGDMSRMPRCLGVRCCLWASVSARASYRMAPTPLLH